MEKVARRNLISKRKAFNFGLRQNTFLCNTKCYAYSQVNKGLQTVSVICSLGGTFLGSLGGLLLCFPKPKRNLKWKNNNEAYVG